MARHTQFLTQLAGEPNEVGYGSAFEGAGRTLFNAVFCSQYPNQTCRPTLYVAVDAPLTPLAVQ